MRFILRLLGFLCVAGGFVALVIDGTRAIANGAFTPVAFGDTVARTFPTFYPQIEPLVSQNLHPFLWNPVLTTLFALPTFAVGLVFGFALMIVARVPDEDIGFTKA